jgi:heavy metal efflux system protein
MKLRNIQDFLISPQLKPMRGVNEVNSFGGFVKTISDFRESRLTGKYELTLRNVVEAVEKNNANAAGGFIVRGSEQTYMRGIGLLMDLADISDSVFKAQSGKSVTDTVHMGAICGLNPC